MALVSRLKKLEFSGQPVGVERVSRVLKFARNINCDWVRVTEYAPRGLVRVFERRHGLAELVERGVRVSVERLRVITPHRERDIMTIPKNASRHGNRLAQQRLGFLSALEY